MDNHKLGIIVPYRDRYFDLVKFKSHITEYLSDSGIDYSLIIVEQDDAKSFNRGKLLNIGTIYAKKLGCDYVVFHDLDMLPEKVDYSYSDIPLHLATNLIGTEDFNRIVFDQYFGGVTLFPIKTFEEINGYSNNYWGWGYEDDDLLYRCEHSKVPLNSKQIRLDGGNTAALKFNGKNAYVKSPNIFDFINQTSYNPDGKITIFVSYCMNLVYLFVESLLFILSCNFIYFKYKNINSKNWSARINNFSIHNQRIRKNKK